MEISKLNDKLNNRNIYLYGNNEAIISFIEEYQDRIHIVGVLTDLSKEITVQHFSKWNIPTLYLEQTLYDDNPFIILCTVKDNYNSYERRLEYFNLMEYEDYLSSKLVDSIIHQKRLMVCMGTELLNQISLAFRSLSKIDSSFSIIYYPHNELLLEYYDNYNEYIHICRCCDIYIHSVCKLPNFSSKIIDQSLLKGDCITVSVSDFGFAGYFPYYEKDRSVISDFMLREHARLDMNYDTLAMSRCDKWLLELCKNYTDSDIIYDKLCSEQYLDSDEIISHFNKELLRIAECERGCDIKIADYLQNNCHRLLYRNLNEMDCDSIVFYATKILDFLNLEYDSFNKTALSSVLNEHLGSELILYPLVAEALSIDNSYVYRPYKVVSYYHTRYLPFEEYLRFNIEYMLLSMDVINYTGMNQKLLEQ